MDLPSFASTRSSPRAGRVEEGRPLRRGVSGVIDQSQLHSNGQYHEVYRLIGRRRCRCASTETTPRVSPATTKQGVRPAAQQDHGDRPGRREPRRDQWLVQLVGQRPPSLERRVPARVSTVARIAQQYEGLLRLSLYRNGRALCEACHRVGDGLGLAPGDVVSSARCTGTACTTTTQMATTSSSNC